MKEVRDSARVCAALVVLLALAACAPGDRPQEAVTARSSALTVDFGDCSRLRVAVGVGFGHTCALLSDGTVECWGSNGAGELGNGTISTARNYFNPTPAAVTGISGATAIAVGWYHTCALLADRTVKCWGSGPDNALGNGSTTGSAVPVAVTGLTDVVSIAAGFNATCAVLANGTARCWGDNTTGVLGNGSQGNPITPPTTPSPVVGLNTAVQIAMGGDHACARLSNLGLVCWGSNASGQLGNGAIGGISTVPVTVTNGAGTRVVVAGGSHTCNLRNNGSVLCWGDNATGQLGNGTNNPATTPGFVSFLVLPIQDLFSSSTSNSTCALTQTGALSCWGANQYGQLGNGGGGSATTPTNVAGLTQAASASIGLHTCAVTTAGLLSCWGLNISGELGVGSTNPQAAFTPITVPGTTFAPDGQTCRASVSVCDVAETCTGSAPSCPADAFAPPGGTCRASAGVCDVAETCTGSAPSCPADTFAPPGGTCRGIAGACDVAESCTGTSAACPPDAFLPATQACRLQLGLCDAAEFCSGSSAACPQDRFLGPAILCRPKAGPCDTEARCTTGTASCPPNEIVPAGTTCREANGPCDRDEACDGVATTCPTDEFVSAGTVCGPPDNACQSPAVCLGTVSYCPLPSWLPGCGGGVAGTISFAGQPVSGLAAGSLGVTGLSSNSWTSPVAAASGHYDSGVVLPGAYTVLVNALQCGESSGVVGSSAVDVLALTTTNANFDISATAALVTATVPAGATLTLRASEECDLVTIDASRNLAVFVVPRTYEATLTNAISGDMISVNSFTAAAGQTIPLTFGALDGATCSDDSECGTGHCVDSVCCDFACGGNNLDDCQACNVLTGADEDGRCTLLPSSHVCRSGVDICDVQETCNGQETCPADALAAPAGKCDEAATGTQVEVTLNQGKSHPGGLTLTFDQITLLGPVTVSEVSTTLPPPPTGYKLVSGSTLFQAWDLATTASYTGSIKVCFNYGASGVSAADESSLVLMHDDGHTNCPDGSGGMTPWCNIALDPPNTVAKTICGTTMSLSPFALMLRIKKGQPCAQSSECDGLACVDGVCCDSVCGGGATNDCQACSVAAGAPADGVCAPVAASRVCRPSAGSCDVAETCTGLSAACPTDVFAAAGSVCAPAGSCQSPGLCSGASATCPGVRPIPGCGADTTPPVWSNVPGTIVAYATCTAGAVVTYTKPRATDAIDGDRPVTCTPAPGAMFAPGKRTVTCKASDKKGNAAAPVTFTVWVQYKAPGDGTFFLSPIRPDGSSVFKIGRPVPSRFKLGGPSAGIKNLVAKFAFTKTSNNIQGTVDSVGDETVADADMTFKHRALLGWYAYRWKTSGQTKGTYQLRADLGDGVTHQINVSLKP